MRIASERAKFAFSFVRLGLIPGDGGAWLLPRAVGRAVARELAFTGEMFDAEHAQRIGLVSRVVPHETLMEQALTLASRVSANAGSTLRLTKRLMRQAEDTTLEQALEAAASGQALAQYTVAHRTAVIAAAGKQTPSFGELD
jgi:enoyl-CoA hydratase/carnithine racemase